MAKSKPITTDMSSPFEQTYEIIPADYGSLTKLAIDRIEGYANPPLAVYLLNQYATIVDIINANGGVSENILKEITDATSKQEGLI